MNKKSEIYKSEVLKDNNSKAFYSKYDDGKKIDNIKNIEKDNRTIEEKLDTLFKNSIMNYTKEVKVILENNNVIVTRFIKKYDKYILTIDNDKIIIDNIKDIII